MAFYRENIIRKQTIKYTDICHNGFAHWHQRAEFAYILEGEYLAQVGKHQQRCNAGDLVFIRSGEIHSFSNGSGCQIAFCTFDPAILFRLLPEIRFPKSFISAHELFEARLSAEVADLFQKIYWEQQEKQTFFETRMLSNIISLYVLMVRHFEDAVPCTKQALARLEQFHAALEYIEQHYAENITLSHIAKAISYNSTYVSTLFVSCSGVNFKTYLDNLRIKKAVDMLHLTTLPISDISAQCGYDNVRTFNNVFKRITGQSPSELRKGN